MQSSVPSPSRRSAFNMKQAAAEASDEERAPSPTRDENENSRTFMLALQELKNLRPQLYQAADYCEHQYLFGDNKQGVLDNIKDYSVKALVNAVDHLGTVAYKLNDLIAQQQEEWDAAQLVAAALAQRLQACHEHSDREGLKQQTMAKTMHINHRHYTVSDQVDPVAVAAKRAGQRSALLLRETFDPSQATAITSSMQIPKAQSPRPQTPPNQTCEQSEGSEASFGPQAWHFASEQASAPANAPSRLPSTSVAKQHPPPSALSLSRGSFQHRTTNASFKGAPSLSISPTKTAAGHPAAAAPAQLRTQRSGSVTPLRTAPIKIGSLDLEKTMFTTPSPALEDPKNSRGKGILRSLLGRRS